MECDNIGDKSNNATVKHNNAPEKTKQKNVGVRYGTIEHQNEGGESTGSLKYESGNCQVR